MTTTRKHATKKSDDVRRPKDVRTSKVQNALKELQTGGASGHPRPLLPLMFKPVLCLTDSY